MDKSRGKEGKRESEKRKDMHYHVSQQIEQAANIQQNIFRENESHLGNTTDKDFEFKGI